MTPRLAGESLPALFCLCGLLSFAGCDSGSARDTAAADSALQQFADFMKGASAYQVRSRIEIVVTDATGERHDDLSPPAVERTIAVRRPGQFVLKTDDGIGIVSDGTSLAAWSTPRGKYWRGSPPVSLADLMSTPIGAFFRTPLNARPLLWAGSDPTAALTLGLGQPAYIGRETLDGRQAHHLRVPGSWEQGSDLISSPILDVWIAAEGDPVPLQAIMKQPPRELTASGGTRITATVEMVETFRDWKFEDPAADQFAFERPEGVRRVAGIGEVLVDDHPLVGLPAPELNLSLLDGSTLRLADHAGKEVVMLDFWATWCQPCLMELPVITQVARDYRDRSVVLYAVNQREKQHDVRMFMAAADLPVTAALDSHGMASTAYHAQSIPHLVLIGKDGKVQAVHSGFGPGLEERVRQELDALVDGVDLAKEGFPDESAASRVES